MWVLQATGHLAFSMEEPRSGSKPAKTADGSMLDEWCVGCRPEGWKHTLTCPRRVGRGLLGPLSNDCQTQQPLDALHA